MRSYDSLRTILRTAALLAAVTSPGLARGDYIQVTVTNDQPAGGFGISPLWAGVHDGTFTTFTPGAPAASPIETLAELGSTAGLTAAFAGLGAQGTAGGAPLGPGGSGTTVLNVTNPSVDRYVSFASMVVPSNDYFFGNASPTAFALFDAAGHFNGPLTLQIYGSNVWDAGSEVDNIKYGAAFVVGDNATDHVAAGGTVNLVFGGPNDPTTYLNSINGVATPYGYNISHVISANDLVATVTFQAVPEPSTMVLFGVGAAVLVGASRGRRKGNG